MHAAIPSDDLARYFVPVSFDKDQDIAHKALGIKWEPKSDVLVFSIKLEKLAYPRKGILATYSRIFDPTSITQPLLIASDSFIVRVKCAHCAVNSFIVRVEVGLG